MTETFTSSGPVVITASGAVVSTRHLVFYKSPCPRCDRPSRDDAEWRRFAREAIAEVDPGEQVVS